MPVIGTEQLVALQKHTNNIRNLCILAHVDHGKTTLSDLLLASNGIISQKLAGKIRYLDSREDEQIRGITMESSGISLYFQIRRQLKDTVKADEYLINLIDSPGHVDFASEVSTASRLCDGALVLVDVVEGVCTQTHAVLRQARQERVRPMLVLNKLDRLILELRMTPLEAYQHMRRIVEQVNAVMAQLFADERLEIETRRHERQKALEQQMNTSLVEEKAVDFDEDEDDRWFFAPEYGNVIFCSAIDGWAFRVEQFSQMYAARLGVNEALLRRTFWGDYYIDTKAKRVIGHKQLKGRPLKPIFVQLALENIWAVYQAVMITPDMERVQKIVKTLGVKVLPRDLRSKDTRALLSTILGQWLPLSANILLGVVDKLPSPVEAQAERLSNILYPEEKPTRTDKGTLHIVAKNDLERSLYACDHTENAPTVAFVTKMFSMPAELLPEYKRRQLTAEEMRERGRQLRAMRAAQADSDASTTVDTDATKEQEDEEKDNIAPDGEVLIGYARVYSGCLRVGQRVRVLGPKYHPDQPNQHVSEVTIQSLYMLMGRELTKLDCVPAGNVCGIGGLDGVVLKTATLTTAEDCPSFGSLRGKSAPIVRVAVEPENPSKMPELVQGLRLLNQADPCVEVVVQSTGEHILMTAGELHLERCIKDLRERFAKIDIRVSPPIVPFRETIVAPPVADPEALAKSKQPILFEAAGGRIRMQMRARPLPKRVVEILRENRQVIGILQGVVDGRTLDQSTDQDSTAALTQQMEQLQVASEDMQATTLADVDERTLSDKGRQAVQKLMDDLRKAFSKEKDADVWSDVLDNLWTFGPKRVGPNILVNRVPGFQRASPFQQVLYGKSPLPATSDVQHLLSMFDKNITAGFQLATHAGPLCAEPCVGVCWFLESFEITMDEVKQDDEDAARIASLSRFAGQVITSTRDACRKAMLQWSPRLMLATYSCDIQATSEILGRVYGVVARRRGRIVAEEMDESTAMFCIQAKLPVIESFGFADEIRKRTSGAAIPQLIFSGYEILDEDPFWVPSTEEELEDLGEKADRENVARRYMDAVRKRKGMFVEKKIIEHAEKQRTLKK